MGLLSETLVKSNIKTQIIQAIEQYMNRSNGRYSDWYIGIAKTPRTRLFNDHNVSETFGTWIYRDAGTSTIAREIETHFLMKGCKGGDGGGDCSTKFVYAYKITGTTVQ